MASRFVLPFQSVYNLNGTPLDGAKMYFYETDGVTPKDTFSDVALTTPNANPVIADNYGRFDDIFLNVSDYEVNLTDKNDVTQPGYPADPITDLDATLRADLASTALDDGTKGFHLVSYPLVSGETGVVNYEYPPGNVKRYGVTLDGVTDDTTAWQVAFDNAKNFDLILVAEAGYSVITSTLVYDTTGLGTSNGVHIRGAGREVCGFINKITAGGATISLTSGTASSDFQFGGEISGFAFTESGSGSNSHGIEYRGCWYYTFYDIKMDNLNGAGFRPQSSVGDGDSSAFVVMDYIQIRSCLLPAIETTGNASGISHHKITNYEFANNGGSDANVVLDGALHIKMDIGGIVAIPTSPRYVATSVGIRLKGTSITPQNIVLGMAEYGNSLYEVLVIEEGLDIEIGPLRIVKRPGDNTMINAIRFADGTPGVIHNVTINPINVYFDDATPPTNLFNIGTALGANSIGNGLTIRSPRLNTFASGNTYLTFSSGAEDRAGHIEDEFGNILFQRPVLRYRQTLGIGTLNMDLLNGNWQQFDLNGVGAYTLNPPSNGARDGATMIVSFRNISGGAITMTFATGMHSGGFVAPAAGEYTQIQYIYDSVSARWQPNGAWSTPSIA